MADRQDDPMRHHSDDYDPSLPIARRYALHDEADPVRRDDTAADDAWDTGWGGIGSEPPAPPRGRAGPWRWVMRGAGIGIVLLVLAIGWLAITAPLSKSLKPPTPPSITLTADDGTPIARRGAIIGAPVDAAKLPAHVTEAFVAIEDRRFYSHWGIDPRGIARAAWHNLGAGGVREGGSTITQQLAKNAFLDSDRTAARKVREMMISFWLEAWLTKDEILSRYLSNVYFGDNCYGLTAAAQHYFGRKPANLNIGQAAMLAGLVKAPSRLAPTGNLAGARKREMIVVGAMVDAGFLTKAEGDGVQPQRVRNDPSSGQLPSGTYFADWVLPEARDQAGEIRTEATVETTLDRTLQRTAERAVRQAGLRQAQVALVAMRRDGRVVAMVGGKDYGKSAFNRATQARRQPGSTFKLFVCLAAMRSGMTPTSLVDDSPVDIAGWKPKNDDGRYLGNISLTRAFARSSNVAAARLTQEVGVKNVIKAARDLGISTPIPDEATIGLGTAEVSLLELTAAYAGIANGSYPVQPRGLEHVADKSWYQSLSGGSKKLPDNIRREMLDLLGASIRGTGRAAALTVDSYGKTGTTQDNRDAWFIGFAGDLVVGVWVGNDDNKPNPGLHGGGIPAQIWRNFMVSALDLAPVVKVAPAEDIDPEVEMAPYPEENDAVFAPDGPPMEGTVRGFGLEMKMGQDGSISINPADDRGGPSPPPSPRDQRRPEEGPPPGF